MNWEDEDGICQDPDDPFDDPDEIDNYCERCGIELDGAGIHYHCGHCNSTKTTSMLGHYLNGEFTCKPEDL